MSAAVVLIALSESEWRALGDDPAAVAAVRGFGTNGQDGLLRGLGPETAAFLARMETSPRWGPYLALDRDSAAVVGTCAYKGPPDADDAVEIAYYTFPPFEGRGYATAMAAALTARAGADPPVRTVRAHTLPERNASARILEKLGFVHLGLVTDPEDGPVWRWERAPSASPS